MKIRDNQECKLHSSNISMKKFNSDCSKCSGLCCTALFFSKIDGFPEDKVAGVPCCNLEKNFLCKIHQELEKKGMKGCIAYDCFGAGQFVTQQICHGDTWKDNENKTEIFHAFHKVFQLFQIRYYLAEASSIIPAEPIKTEIESLIKENEKLCANNLEDIDKIDVETHRDRVNNLLHKTCEYVNQYLHITVKNQSTDYMARKCNGMNLSGYDMSMKLLIAANFTDCKFYGTNFLGADTRDTNFSNADLREALFLTQGQINASKGNRKTLLPDHLTYPVTWK